MLPPTSSQSKLNSLRVVIVHSVAIDKYQSKLNSPQVEKVHSVAIDKHQSKLNSLQVVIVHSVATDKYQSKLTSLQVEIVHSVVIDKDQSKLNSLQVEKVQCCHRQAVSQNSIHFRLKKYPGLPTIIRSSVCIATLTTARTASWGSNPR